MHAHVTHAHELCFFTCLLGSTCAGNPPAQCLHAVQDLGWCSGAGHCCAQERRTARSRFRSFPCAHACACSNARVCFQESVQSSSMQPHSMRTPNGRQFSGKSTCITRGKRRGHRATATAIAGPDTTARLGSDESSRADAEPHAQRPAAGPRRVHVVRGRQQMCAPLCLFQMQPCFAATRDRGQRTVAMPHRPPTVSCD